MNKEELLIHFLEHFGEGAHEPQCFFAPGRVNVIGEHQDYNGGHVFPAALKVGIHGVIRRRDDKMVRLFSANIGHEVTINLDEPILYSAENDWANYPIGILGYCKEQGLDLPGMDLYYNGNLPAGAGLSSSACMLDLTGYMVWSLLGVPIDHTKLAEMAMNVEYNFIGVKVGIMDMYAISHGKEGHGVLLNCTDIVHRHVPLNWHGYTLVIMNTNKERSLAGTNFFNERKESCEDAFRDIQKIYPVASLAQAPLEAIDAVQDEVSKKRARHVITENLRVLEFMEYLEAVNLEGVAKCLNASHESLKYDYEVTGHELDTIVSLAKAQPGCIAARMTGAGFGGCAIALVNNDNLTDFVTTLPKLYKETIGVEPTMYIAEIGDGVRAL